MNVRVLSYLFGALLLASCATKFEKWEGPAIAQGHGGTREVKHGMDVWTYGAPPWRFQLLGLMRNDDLDSQMIKTAREQGGDAFILLSSVSELRGMYNVGSAQTQFFGNTASTFGSSLSIPIRKKWRVYAVVKYLR